MSGPDNSWNVLRLRAIEALPELLKEASPQKTALRLLQKENKIALRKSVDARKALQRMRLHDLKSPAKFIEQRRTAAERAADEKQAIIDRLGGSS